MNQSQKEYGLRRTKRILNLISHANPGACIWCGKTLPPQDRGRKRKYCSSDCSLKASIDGERTRVCPYCSKFFTAIGKRRYCSRRCREQYNRLFFADGSEKQRPRHKHICATCGVEWESTCRNSKYCASCQGSIIQKYSIRITCDECGKQAYKVHADPNRHVRFCSKECLRAAERKSDFQSRDNLGDRYIKTLLAGRGIKQPYPPTLIEIKRQQLIMHRNLKEWRAKNEPGNANVQGEQLADE